MDRVNPYRWFRNFRRTPSAPSSTPSARVAPAVSASKAASPSRSPRSAVSSRPTVASSASKAASATNYLSSSRSLSRRVPRSTSASLRLSRLAPSRPNIFHPLAPAAASTLVRLPNMPHRIQSEPRDSRASTRDRQGSTQIASRVSAAIGTHFFRSMTEHLARVLEADCVYTRIRRRTDRARSDPRRLAQPPARKFLLRTRRQCRCPDRARRFLHLQDPCPIPLPGRPPILPVGRTRLRRHPFDELSETPHRPHHDRVIANPRQYPGPQGYP